MYTYKLIFFWTTKKCFSIKIASKRMGGCHFCSKGHSCKNVQFCTVSILNGGSFLHEDTFAIIKFHLNFIANLNIFLQ